MERIAMSQQERDELDWLRRAQEGSISQREAAQKMGVSDRWVRKLLKRMIKEVGTGTFYFGPTGSGPTGSGAAMNLVGTSSEQTIAVPGEKWKYQGPPGTVAEITRGKRNAEIEKAPGGAFRPEASDNTT
jgi:hypothetical protein